MKENRFAQSLEALDKKEATPTQENDVANPELINQLFPGDSKAIASHSHSFYLRDDTYKKLQKLSRKENKSISFIMQKILDNIL